jgi:Ca-activated chloride channel homolog
MNNKITYRLIWIVLSTAIPLLIFWIVAYVTNIFLKSNYQEYRLERPDILNYVWLIAFAFILYVLNLVWKNRVYNKWSTPSLLTKSSSKISTTKASIKSSNFFIALSLLFVAYANPQFGSSEKTSEVKGIDIIVALDISNSMMAKDLSDSQTRLDIAKRAIEDLTKNLHGDRLGIVVFAGKAFTQLPITSDYSAAKLFLSTISTDMIYSQGTAIGNAIEISLNSFDFNSPTQKAIVIISDGEDHEEGALEMASKASEMGVILNAIGVGSVKGSPIPVYKSGKFLGNKKDSNGNTVLTKLNEEALQQIVSTGNGSYAKASASNFGLNDILEELNKLQKNAYGKKEFQLYDDKFQWFLAPAILLFLLSIAINERKLNHA